VRIGRVVGNQHLGHAGNARGRLGGCLAAATGDQHMDFTTQCLRGRDGVMRCGLQFVVAVLSNYQSAHQITFASLRSLSTSSATEPTLMPALRSGGGSTFNTRMRGATSTPRSAGVSVSSCFFFAFMMFGSDA